MNQASVVYGYIKHTDNRPREHLIANQRAVMALPPAENWPLLSREMFAAGGEPEDDGEFHFHTHILHFGAACPGVEYEWRLWLEQFERLLETMHWVSAVVHLETELAGRHSFYWQADNGHHQPGDKIVAMQGEWVLD